MAALLAKKHKQNRRTSLDLNNAYGVYLTELLSLKRSQSMMLLLAWAHKELQVNKCLPQPMLSLTEKRCTLMKP